MLQDCLRHQGLLVSCCLAVFFLNLGAARLFDEDEPKNAECAREMFERGDAIVPTFNDELRTDKPIMIYWLMMAAFQFLEVSEFSVRLPSAVMATGSVLLLYQIGVRLFDRQAGLWSAVILASTMMFVAVARACTPDATLIAFTTLAMLIFVRFTPAFGNRNDSPRAERSRWPTGFVPQSRLAFLAMYSAMALAVLTKGPVGFLLPCCAIGLFLLLTADRPEPARELSLKEPLASATEFLRGSAGVFAPKRFFAAVLAMRPTLLVLALGVIALPWYVAVGLETDGAWLNGFLGKHNFGRFTSVMEGHRGPVFYYLAAVLAGFFPWSIVLPVCLWEAWRSARLSGEHHRGVTFLLCWIAVYVLFFSLAQTKLPNYVLPCYPALALLTARTLVRWKEGLLPSPRWAVNTALGTLIFVGTALAVGLPVFSFYYLPDYSTLGLLGTVPLLVGCLAFWQSRRGRRGLMLHTLGTGSVLFVVVVFGVTAPWVSLAQESPQLGTAAAELSGAEGRFATLGYFAPNLPFYARRHVEHIRDLSQVPGFFAARCKAVLCVQADTYPELSELLPDTVIIKRRIRRFLRDEEILVLYKPETETPPVQRTSAQMRERPFN